MSIRIGQGWDFHRLVVGRPLILGGVPIAFEKGLLGHSDADVLLHAVIDALLGAAGLGDIGQRFPDTAAEWKGADSRVLLRNTHAAVCKIGFEIVNVDSTVILEAPKLAPYLARMVENIASDLQMHPTAITIKAKTHEGIGLIGTGEAACAQAICLLIQKQRAVSRPA